MSRNIAVAQARMEATTRRLRPITPTGGSPTAHDDFAIHGNEDDEFSSLTAKATPDGTDIVMIEQAGGGEKRRETLTQIFAALASPGIALGDIVHIDTKANPPTGGQPFYFVTDGGVFGGGSIRVSFDGGTTYKELGVDFS